MDQPANERIDLQEIRSEFQAMDVRDRLEMLLEFSESLPELPERYIVQRDAGENRIHECQSPVFLWVELVDGNVEIYADVPRSAPTVRGFVGLLVAALSGATTEEVLAIDPSLLRQLGLVEALGMVRMRGLHAILHRLKTSVAIASAAK
jgi:cysteine desulfuration protein SufE